MGVEGGVRYTKRMITIFHGDEMSHPNLMIPSNWFSKPVREAA
jgi:hypothetical protein